MYVYRKRNKKFKLLILFFNLLTSHYHAAVAIGIVMLRSVATAPTTATTALLVLHEVLFDLFVVVY
jgi:hypothetical protein